MSKAQKIIESTNVEFSTSAAIVGNTVLPAVVGSQTKYQIIYADPAWQYKESWGNGQTGYKTMSTDDICNLPVKNITDEKAHLYLWVTNPFLSDGLRVCKEWGFEYKTLLTWHKLYSSGKPEMGMGYYFRGCTEHIIFGVKGGMKCKTKLERNCIEFPEENFIPAINPKQHSRKPNLFREKIVKDWSGDLPRLEMFARSTEDLFDDELFKGWDLWGNQVRNSIDLNAANNGR